MGTRSYTWKHGRQLESISDVGYTWMFTYDANGMRKSRSNGSATYTYTYNGSKLMQMTRGTDVLDFYYDASGTPVAFKHNGTTYYYVTTIQGDILLILDADGEIVVSYDYDAWGKLLAIGGSMATTLGTLNPLTYRGYVYDHEYGLYYLQSRYYNPELGRFINADAFVSTGQGMLGNNMFAYCNNNPVNNADPTGTLTDGQIHDSVLAAIILDYMKSGYYNLYMKDNLIYYNGKNVWSGWGYCDLYDISTGEVWELKKNSSSYTCTTKYAERQLGKYVNGRLQKHPDLELFRGGDLVFGEHTYTIGTADGTYTITYWQEGQGILRYSYTFQKNNDNKKQAEQDARLACILVSSVIVAAGFIASGGTAASIIPLAPTIVEICMAA